MKKWVIAIDGFSSTGKSSISKIIAKKLGLIHLDTGALYRGVTYYALQNCLNENQAIDFEKLFFELENIDLEFRNENGEMWLYLNGDNISKEIRMQEISENVSQIAMQKKVRDYLLFAQRKMAEKGGVIMDGRDIGTVILPNADYKFFLTASPEERAKRRFLELQESGEETTLELVKDNLIARDKMDSERAIAPLKMAEDAILIDNTFLTKEETIDTIIAKIV